MITDFDSAKCEKDSSVRRQMTVPSRSEVDDGFHGCSWLLITPTAVLSFPTRDEQIS